MQATADCATVDDTHTPKGRSGSVSVGSLGPGVQEILFQPSECLWWVWGFDSKCDFTPYAVLLCFSFALGCGVFFFFFFVGSNILLSMVVLQRAAILEFSHEKMNVRSSTPPSFLFCRPPFHLLQKTT